MIMKAISIQESKTISESQEMVKKFGRMAFEVMNKRGSLEKFRQKISERLGRSVSTEDLTADNNGALFTTIMSSFVEQALRPKLVAAGAVKTIDDFNGKGRDSIKIPLRGAVVAAADLPDTGAVTYDSNNYGSSTISLTFKYAAVKLTHELLRYSAFDLMREEVGQIGLALSEKLDSDIISAFDAATTTGGGNAVHLGTSTVITYNTFVDAFVAMLDNDATPSLIVTNPTTLGNLMKDTDFKAALVEYSGSTNGMLFKTPMGVFNMPVVATTQCPADTIYIVDTERTGYVFNGSNVEMFDGRLGGNLAYEIIGARSYGIGITLPKALYKIKENTA